jgi:YD repeat-containing protein
MKYHGMILAVLVVLCFVIQSFGLGEEFTYDSLQRLTSITYDNGGSIAYTYDTAGNRLTLVSQASTPAATITVGKMIGQFVDWVFVPTPVYR